VKMKKNRISGLTAAIRAWADSINNAGLRLLLNGGGMSDIREAVDWERKQSRKEQL